MTTEHYLWAIFALLCVLLVIQIITARRGPWAKPSPPPPAQVLPVLRNGPKYVVGIDPAGKDHDEKIVVVETMGGHVRILRDDEWS